MLRCMSLGVVESRAAAVRSGAVLQCLVVSLARDFRILWKYGLIYLIIRLILTLASHFGGVLRF